MQRIGVRCRLAVLLLCVSLVSVARSASGAIMFSASGTSAAGNPVSFAATLGISGNTLTVQLDNTSPVDSADAADVLTSFYFDIQNGTNRPTLSYTAASGFLYLVRRNAADLPYFYTPQTYTPMSGMLSNIRALNNGDNSWQFRTLNSTSAPQLGFGIGTVGNNGLSPNGFTPQIVGQGNTMINFAIYRGGDIDPIGVLDNKYLVKNNATFTFTGVSGYTEANIVGKVVFGMGTGPDSTLTAVPEPGTIAIVAGAMVSAAAACGLRRWGTRRSERTPAAGPSHAVRKIRMLGQAAGTDRGQGFGVLQQDPVGELDAPAQPGVAVARRGLSHEHVGDVLHEDVLRDADQPVVLVAAGAEFVHRIAPAPRGRHGDEQGRLVADFPGAGEQQQVLEAGGRHPGPFR